MEWTNEWIIIVVIVIIIIIDARDWNITEPVEIRSVDTAWPLVNNDSS